MSEKQDELRLDMPEISKSLKPKNEESISSQKFMKLKLSEYGNCSSSREGSYLLRRDQKKVWLESYGCAASIADSELIAGILKNRGFEIATHPNRADLNLIVTCSVKDVTEHRMIYRISRLSKSGKPLVVAGCLPKADPTRVQLASPHASLLGPNSIDKTAEVVDSAIAGNKMTALADSISDKTNVPRVRVNPVISIVQIATGCMSVCSFCQTKLAKGWLKSYRIGDIVRQVKNDIKDGCKEIWLTSTDNGCYGKDAGSNIVDLLESCTDIDGQYKIRVGMMNPMFLSPILDRLIQVFVENEKIFKFLHIPVQSGSERILRKMKRGHTAKTFSDLVASFRTRVPKITIATDVIVGFPSETEHDFYETTELINETQPDIVNASKYSARPGTAATVEKQINTTVVKKRTKQLHHLIDMTSRKRNSIWSKWYGEILIDEKRGNKVQGRNYAYKPVVVTGNLNIGTHAFVYISGYTNHVLEGTINFHGVDETA